MKLSMFAVWDSKVSEYLNPFAARSIPEATRAFTDICNDPGHHFYKYSDDYTLFKLGEFDPSSGIFDSNKTDLGLATTYKRIQSNVQSPISV